jgi:hypothetical protein
MKTRMNRKSIDKDAAATSTAPASMKTYRFFSGNWTTGASGFIARVRARTPEEALELLRRVLPSEKTIDPDGSDEDVRRVRHIDAYFEANNVTLDDIDEDDFDDDEEDEDGDRDDV